MGTSINYSALAAVPDGFVAAWTGSNLQVRHVDMDGGVSSLFSQGPVTNGRLALDAVGNEWVAVWANNNASVVNCVTSTSNGNITQVRAVDGGTMSALSTAISPTGMVAVTARSADRRFLGAHAGGGCPSLLPRLPFAWFADGTGVAWTNATSGDGFRYVLTGEFNAADGIIAVAAIEQDGGLEVVSRASSGRAPQDSAVIASEDRSTVITSYGASAPPDVYDLMLHGASASLTGGGSAVVVNDTVTTGWWNVSRCGPGCVMTILLGYSEVTNAPLSFFRDVAPFTKRATYDALCEQQATRDTGATVSIAYSNGRIGMLLTDETHVNFYLCELPTLP